MLTSPLIAVLLVCVVFGGSAAASRTSSTMNRRRRRTIEKPATWFPYPSWWRSALIVVGGAIAFLFFITAVGGLSDFNGLEHQIQPIADSVIAGFAARSLLPRMVGRFADAGNRRDVADGECAASLLLTSAAITAMTASFPS